MVHRTSFDQYIESCKCSGVISGYKGKVSMDTLNVMLSMWPFLKEEDKIFCNDLLKKSIRGIKREDFNSLLEMWRLYSKDVGFFKGALEKVPRYYQAAAEKLRHLEIDMNARHDFLSRYAEYTLANLQKRYHQYLEEPPADLLEKLKKLFKSLNYQTAEADYYFKRTKDTLKQKTYVELKKRINLNIFQLLFTKKEWQKNSQLRSELRTYILSYINDLSSMDEIKAFKDFLVQKEYFKLSASNLKVFYIEQLIQFKSGQYDDVISDTIDFKKSVSYVKKENMKDYSDILLLFTDAYISSYLLISATDALKKVEKKKFNLTDIYWRKMQIESIISADEEDEKEQKEKKQQYELITNSIQIRLNSTSIEKTVYLIEKNEDENKNKNKDEDKKERKSVIEIQFSDLLKKKIISKSFHLLQVFSDGKLVDETYLSKLKLPVKIPIPIKERFSKNTLTIKIL